MGAGKRASMREGPLAALFRKTEQDSRCGGHARGAAARSRGSPSHTASPTTTHAGTGGPRAHAEPRRAAQRTRRPRSALCASRGRGRAAAAEACSRRATRAKAAYRTRRSAPARRRPRPRFPTPQERLRAAFSSESPRTSSSAGIRPQRADRVYARAEYSEPRSTSLGQPRLRVVGVGGGGVNAVNRMVEAESPASSSSPSTPTSSRCSSAPLTSPSTSAPRSRAGSARAPTPSSAASPRWRSTTRSSRC